MISWGLSIWDHLGVPLTLALAFSQRDIHEAYDSIQPTAYNLIVFELGVYPSNDPFFCRTSRENDDNPLELGLNNSQVPNP